MGWEQAGTDAGANHIDANTFDAGMPTRAPGKVSRTERLPTGIPLVDQGLACDDAAPDDPACLPTERDRDRLLSTVLRSADAWAKTQVEGLSSVELDLLTQHAPTWGGGHQVLYLLISVACINPLAAGGAAVAGRLAGHLATRGSHRAAWTLAGVEQTKLAAAWGTVSSGVRSSLTHRAQTLPATQLEYIEILKEIAIQVPRHIVDGIVEHQLNDQEILAIDRSLNDPAHRDIAQIKGRVQALLGQFDANRLGSIGKKQAFGGGYERAAPVRARVRGDEFLVLCESHGIRGSALAINGAKPSMTMESLVFVRIAEPAFHALMIAEYEAERQAPVPFLDFNQASVRNAHRWFGDLYVELNQRADVQQLALRRGDPDADEDGGAATVAAR